MAENEPDNCNVVSPLHQSWLEPKKPTAEEPRCGGAQRRLAPALPPPSAKLQ